MIRLYVAQPSFGPNHLAYYNDRPEPVTIRGLVSDAPLEKEKALQLRISATSITLEGKEISVKGDFIALVPLLSDYRYGDLVEASGELETPPVWEDFSYRDYLARKGVFSILKKPQVRVLGRGRGNPLKHFLLSLRERAHKVLLSVYPEPEASLLAGILLGP
jgi:competence protein ComEC